ncbi:50S ribosomal protein L15 [Leucoagaricus sp. SymC.cos]|nr:50S ribosomal protein L15 [Leucoagaricus sp. SymC.cos]
MASRARLPRVTLANLRPAPGSLHNQKRVGRGEGSGYGRTAGRGAKGQKSRSGPGPKPGFEGGQTPITKLFPKRGFINPNSRTYAPVNLDRIQHWIDQGRLETSPEKPITARELLLSGCVHDVHDGIKILGDGAKHLKTPLYIVASRASKSAIEAIEERGGKIVCKFYNELALRDCMKGRTDRISAAPTRREDIEWYTRHANRGYLSGRTLWSLRDMPFVEDRWRMLVGQLKALRNPPLRQHEDKAA